MNRAPLIVCTCAIAAVALYATCRYLSPDTHAGLCTPLRTCSVERQLGHEMSAMTCYGGPITVQLAMRNSRAIREHLWHTFGNRTAACQYVNVPVPANTHPRLPNGHQIVKSVVYCATKCSLVTMGDQCYEIQCDKIWL